MDPKRREQQRDPGKGNECARRHPLLRQLTVDSDLLKVSVCHAIEWNLLERMQFPADRGQCQHGISGCPHEIICVTGFGTVGPQQDHWRWAKYARKSSV